MFWYVIDNISNSYDYYLSYIEKKVTILDNVKL